MRQNLAGVSVLSRNRNDDGTITSVCGHCRLTIARVFAPTDLQELERRHVCQPSERRRDVRVVHRIYDLSATPSLIRRVLEAER